MQKGKPAEPPKRRFKLPESKTTKIRELTSKLSPGETFDVSHYVRERDLISLNNAHSSHGYSKQGQENYEQIEWDKEE